MIVSESTKEISWWTGISIDTENDTSLRDRREYFKRRYEMAYEAAWEYRSVETARFVKKAFIEFRDFDPASIKQKRWVEISGYKIPLPSVKVDRLSLSMLF